MGPNSIPPEERKAADTFTSIAYEKVIGIAAKGDGGGTDEGSRRGQSSGDESLESDRFAASNPVTTGGATSQGKQRWWAGVSAKQVVGMVFVLVLVVGILGAGILVLKDIFDPTRPAPPIEVALTVWLVVGIVALLILLMAVALVMHFVLGRDYESGPLGMPEGSVSAIIALMLLLVFAMFNSFFFTEIRGGESDGQVSTGVSAEALKQLPQDRILSIQTATPPNANGTGGTYNVKLAAVHTDSTELGRSTVQTLGTLLAAVVAFYFATRATASAILKREQSSASDEAKGKAKELEGAADKRTQTESSAVRG